MNLTPREWIGAIAVVLLFCIAMSAGADDLGLTRIQAFVTLFGPPVAILVLALMFVQIWCSVHKPHISKAPAEQIPVPSTLEILEIFRRLFGKAPVSLNFCDDSLADLSDEWFRDDFNETKQGSGDYDYRTFLNVDGEVRAAVDLGATRVWAVIQS